MKQNVNNAVNKDSLIDGLDQITLRFFFRSAGFANDQFSFLDANLGNIVLLASDKHEVECDIVPTDVSDKRIACETR